MITFKLPTGKQIEHPLTPVTFREYMINIAEKFPPPGRDDNNFYWSFIKDGKWLNTFDNRNKLITDYLNDGDIVFCSMWSLGGPTHWKEFKNNLTGGNMKHPEECCICFDKLSDNEVYDKVLDCSHCFHAICIKDTIDCPICSTKLSANDRNAIKYLLNKY